MNRVFRVIAYTTVLLAMSVPVHAQESAKMCLKTVVIDPGHG